LKANPTPLVDPVGRLEQLQPKSYEYLTAQNPDLNLPDGVQAGFYAQEIELVFPELVKEVQLPARTDPQTGVSTPGQILKSVNYTGLIPYLVEAIQEQNARIDQLQQQLDQCCTSGAVDSHAMVQQGGHAGVPLETDLRIIPNPVAASTQLRYTVATGGRVRLEVSDTMGRLIEVLDEGERTEGEFTFQWNTSGLAPGTYYCTLLVNEEPIVKRAVKLNER
jgi:hypothetical protein